MAFKKGDIIIGKSTRHPIIYLEELDNITFRACIITHANDEQYPDNIRMIKNHFNESDEHGTRYEIGYDETFFVSKCLIKENMWGPFEIKGKLTNEGIRFINDNLILENAVYWKHYVG